MSRDTVRRGEGELKHCKTGRGSTEHCKKFLPNIQQYAAEGSIQKSDIFIIFVRQGRENCNPILRVKSFIQNFRI